MKRFSRFLSAVLMIALVAALVSGLTISANAENAKVTEAMNGVFRVTATFTNEAFYDNPQKDENGNLFTWSDIYDKPGPISMGTAFLIGYTTDNRPILITNYHVVENKDAFLYYEQDGVTIASVQTYKNFAIRVYNDMEIEVEVFDGSEALDFAILIGNKPINGKTALPLNRQTQAPTTPCYALGFPGELDTLLEDIDYTRSSVTSENGSISNVSEVVPPRATGNERVPVYQTNAKISGGCSGGPLVNENGEVIGVNSYTYTTIEGTQFYYAIQIGVVCDALDIFGVPYTDVTKAASVPAVVEEIPSEITPEPAGEIEATPTAAPTLAPEPSDNPQPTTPPVPGPDINWLLIALVAAVLIIAIFVIVLILLNRKKSKPAAETTPELPYRQTPFIAGPTSYGGGTADLPTDVLDSAADQPTTVLVGGGGASVCLVRESTGEKIPISKNIFRIGRDRNRVDYVISNNTAISRSHMAIVSRNGEYFVIDNNTANHTYVNDSVIPANVETPVHEGDVIRLADESFRFGRV